MSVILYATSELQRPPWDPYRKEPWSSDSDQEVHHGQRLNSLKHLPFTRILRPHLPTQHHPQHRPFSLLVARRRRKVQHHARTRKPTLERDGEMRCVGQGLGKGEVDVGGRGEGCPLRFARWVRGEEGALVGARGGGGGAVLFQLGCSLRGFLSLRAWTRHSAPAPSDIGMCQRVATWLRRESRHHEHCARPCAIGLRGLRAAVRIEHSM